MNGGSSAAGAPGISVHVDAFEAFAQTIDALRAATVEDIDTTIATIIGRDTPLPQAPGQARYS